MPSKKAGKKKNKFDFLDEGENQADDLKVESTQVSSVVKWLFFFSLEI